ncbi:hypothetical protein PV325_012947, partial [Microctonus aethiopoides]
MHCVLENAKYWLVTPIAIHVSFILLDCPGYKGTVLRPPISLKRRRQHNVDAGVLVKVRFRTIEPKLIQVLESSKTEDITSSPRVHELVAEKDIMQEGGNSMATSSLGRCVLD